MQPSVPAPPLALKFAEEMKTQLDSSKWQNRLNTIAQETFIAYLEEKHQISLRLIDSLDNCLVFSSPRGVEVALVVNGAASHEEFVIPKDLAIKMAPDFYVNLFFKPQDCLAVIHGVCSRKELWLIGKPTEYQGRFGIAVDTNLINQNINELLWEI